MGHFQEPGAGWAGFSVACAAAAFAYAFAAACCCAIILFIMPIMPNAFAGGALKGYYLFVSICDVESNSELEAM